jgi:antitoxin HicB
MKTDANKTVQYFMDLPYTTVLRRDDDGDYIAHISELPGCSSHGKDRNEALKNLHVVQRAWIEERLLSHLPVPEPEPEEVLPSGKWVQRVPRSLHQKLTRLAGREEVSLNQLVTTILAEAVGQRAHAMPIRSTATGAPLSRRRSLSR